MCGTEAMKVMGVVPSFAGRRPRDQIVMRCSDPGKPTLTLAPPVAKP